MAETDPAAQALEQGYLGTVPDQIENEAYQVDADHADTAKRVLDQHDQMHADAIAASRDPGESTSKRKKSSSTSSSSSSSGSS